MGDELPHRNWDDYVQYGFISTGQTIRWRDAILGFNLGAVFAAYMKGRGFVGIGRIKTSAQMIRDVLIKDKPFLDLNLQCKK